MKIYLNEKYNFSNLWTFDDEKCTYKNPFGDVEDYTFEEIREMIEHAETYEDIDDALDLIEDPDKKCIYTGFILDNEDTFRDAKDCAERMIRERDFNWSYQGSVALNTVAFDNMNDSELARFVIKHFEDITGHKLSEVFLPDPSEDEDIFDMNMVEKTSEMITRFMIGNSQTINSRRMGEFFEEFDSYLRSNYEKLKESFNKNKLKEELTNSDFWAFDGEECIYSMSTDLQMFVDYCADKVCDLGSIEAWEEDDPEYKVQANISLFYNDLRKFDDGCPVYVADYRGDEILIVREDGKVLHSLYMQENLMEFIWEMEFDKIDRKTYDYIINDWEYWYEDNPYTYPEMYNDKLCKMGYDNKVIDW